MKTKSLILLTTIITLPWTAHATDPSVGPAQYSGNSPVIATAYGPYQTASIGEHDDEHIATTAYVKGAYNDTIAAVNKVNNEKQQKMIVHGTGEAVDSNIIGVAEAISAWESGEYYEHIGDNQILSAQATHSVANMEAHAAIQGYNVKIYTTWDTNDVEFVELTEI